MPDQPKKVPLGRVKPRTEAELDALSTVSAADLVTAGEFYKANAPKPLKELWDAGTLEPDA